MKGCMKGCVCLAALFACLLVFMVVMMPKGGYRAPPTKHPAGYIILVGDEYFAGIVEDKTNKIGVRFSWSKTPDGALKIITRDETERTLQQMYRITDQIGIDRQHIKIVESFD